MTTARDERREDRAEVAGRFALAFGIGTGLVAEVYVWTYSGPDGGFLPPPILTFFFYFVPAFLIGLLPGMLLGRIRSTPDWIPLLLGVLLGAAAFYLQGLFE